jgi:hypothetical protein
MSEDSFVSCSQHWDEYKSRNVKKHSQYLSDTKIKNKYLNETKSSHFILKAKNVQKQIFYEAKAFDSYQKIHTDMQSIALLVTADFKITNKQAYKRLRLTLGEKLSESYENFYAKLLTRKNYEKFLIFERIKSHAIHVGSFVRIIYRVPKLEPKRPIKLEPIRAFKRHRRSRYKPSGSYIEYMYRFKSLNDLRHKKETNLNIKFEIDAHVEQKTLIEMGGKNLKISQSFIEAKFFKFFN